MQFLARIFFLLILFLFTGMIGPVVYMILSFRSIHERMRQKNTLGLTAIILGVVATMLGGTTKTFLTNFDAAPDLPFFFNPQIMFVCYFALGALLFLGGIFVLGNLRSARWLIFLGSLLSFLITVFPGVMIVSSMIGEMNQYFNQALDVARTEIGAAVPGAMIFMGTFWPVIRFYAATVIIALPLLDVFFIFVMALAAYDFQSETVFQKDRRHRGVYRSPWDVPKDRL